MKKIIKRREIADDLLFTNPLHPLLKRIYQARGIKSDKELALNFDQLLSYQQLLGIDQAVQCLATALMQQEKFLIVGDFDADGATSTAVAIRALRSFGAKQIDYLVPNRFEFGYGLTPELVQVAKTLQPAVIITVDNGIANHAGVLAAKEAGIRVVVTDHHLPAETLPLADAIVNPNQKGDLFPSKAMAGVGVIFYVMLALRRFLLEKNWFASQNILEPNMAHLLDLVALGTIADVVPLDHNNRILVHQGMQRIRAGRCAVGITALLEIAGKVQSRVVASDVGFAVAPRLNAAGRLDDMSLGIECLISDDLVRTREIAQKLNQLNDERRIIEQDMQEDAFIILQQVHANISHAFGICLFNESWHQGVIGILASRVKDKFHRPVIAFALANQTELKGSCRSVQGLHIRDVLAEISSLHPGLIHKFGGHAMAAGLTISRDAFPQFAECFNQVVSRYLLDTELNQTLLSDGELSAAELVLPIAEVLREAGPWGQAFPEPLFDGLFRLVDQRLVGAKHLKMVLEKDDQVIDAIAFNVDLTSWPNHRCQEIKAAYRVDVNEYKGRRSVQLIIEHMELA